MLIGVLMCFDVLNRYLCGLGCECVRLRNVSACLPVKLKLYTVIFLSFRTERSGSNSADPDQTAPREAV